MRERPTIPTWALDHVRRQLGPKNEVINAVAFRHGLLSGLVLLNTTRGAAVVAKGPVGAPRSALLTYPRDLLTFRCTACATRNVLVDVETPAAAYCTHCGTRNHLGEPAEAADAAPTSAAPPAGPTAKRTPKAKPQKAAPAPKKSAKAPAARRAGKGPAKKRTPR